MSSRRASNLPAHGRTVPAILGSFLALGLVAGVGFAGVTALGLTPDSETVQKPAAAPALPTVKLIDSPADIALTAALNAAPAEWVRAGEIRTSADTPFPFSCPQDGTTAAISLAQDYTTGGNRFQVTVTAHTAGAGATAMQKLNAGISSCRLDTDRVTQTRTGLSVESYTATIRRGTATGTVATFRHGDVIGYVSASDPATAAAAAATVNDLLAAQLNPACVNPNSVAADAARSPHGGSTYTPYTETRTVTVEDDALPDVPATADYQPVDLTAPVPTTTPVNPNSVPDYPVWPAMPAAVKLPPAIVVPAASAPSSADVSVAVEDVAGPGCGWVFTGMSAPTFDADAAAAAEKTALTDTRKSVTAAVKAWRSEVRRYWAGHDQQVTAIAAYNDYAGQVVAVNAAWDAIGRQWADYRSRYATWKADTARRDAFLTEQATASAQYNAELAACEAAKTTAPTPAPSASPAAQPAPAAAPVVDVPPCSATVPVPAILGKSAPAVSAEPAPPADPRPAK